MASIKFSVAVLVCFLSYAASSKCDSDDANRAKVCGNKGFCITVNEETTPVTTRNYSQMMNLTIVCRYEKENSIKIKNFILRWRKDGSVISDNEAKPNCTINKKIIQLSPDKNTTVYTCEKHVPKKSAYNLDESTIITFRFSNESNTDQDGEDSDKLTTKIPSFPDGTQVTPKESLTTKAEDKDTGQSFLKKNWIVLTVVVVIIIIAITFTFVLLKCKKNPKEDKRRLNPKGSRDDIQEISKDQNRTHLEPKLNDFYTDPNSETTSEEYCNPYIATYTQPIPKRLRTPNIQPKPKPKPRKIENYSNPCGLVSDEPSFYNNIANNTEAMYHNGNNHTETWKGKINKSLKINERVHFIDNMAASYSNTGSDKYTPNFDVYSDSELYDVPN